MFSLVLWLICLLYHILLNPAITPFVFAILLFISFVQSFFSNCGKAEYITDRPTVRDVMGQGRTRTCAVGVSLLFARNDPLWPFQLTFHIA